MSLSSKVAVVTGCSQGLGYAIVKKLRQHNARVIGVDVRYPEENDESYAMLNDDLFEFFKIDIRNEKEVGNWATQLAKSYDSLDILVNNAGVHIIGNIEVISVEDFRRTLDVNVMGTFLVTKFLLPLLKQGNDGASIINISSNLGLMAARDRVAYPTSKAAIINFTKCMAMDYAEENIRVNAVAPGAISTEMTKRFMKEMPPEFEKENKAMHALNRFAEPEEIAECVLFLASERSSYCTGMVLSCDGGYTCGK